ncbi:hypothetical protein BDV39DRAFT_171333 [Aspergillus sergii]|uniref:Uncharacterized protein n=1 Tax=Aspergillus sergii TaxID=1034303 RepID=A0A5N6XAG5_9EURO|nr:hypothetical protein BDV39DRAFT_171333 [Aspergillus sergii]
MRVNRKSGPLVVGLAAGRYHETFKQKELAMVLHCCRKAWILYTGQHVGGGQSVR